VYLMVEQNALTLEHGLRLPAKRPSEIYS
jgi:hypothetical protein